MKNNLLKSVIISVILLMGVSNAWGAEYLYLNPGAWNKDGARYAAYFYSNSNSSWWNMTKINDNLYCVEIPASNNTNVIFCRMNGSASANDWNNRWNQSNNLTVSDNKGKVFEQITECKDSQGQWGGIVPLYTKNSTLYLLPNSDWTSNSARFAVCFLNGSETWVSCTKIGETGLYSVTVPNKDLIATAIFCRMNGSASANNWDNKWNQSSDLSPYSGHNGVKIKGWDKSEEWIIVYDGLSAKNNKTSAADNPTISQTLVIKDNSLDVSAKTAKEGYKWSKWTSDNGSFGSSTTQNTKFTPTAAKAVAVANYDLITYNITYNLNGGSGTMTPTSYNIETETFTLPTPTKTGYTFAGWHTKSDFSDAEVTQIAKGSTGNKTLYAQWRPNVSIEGTYHFFPGERINLNIATPNDGVNFSYQWQKLVGSVWTDIPSATATTYTKDEATIEDAGHYRCVVSASGCTNAIAYYNVKCLQLNVYYNDHSFAFTTPLEKVDATASISVDLQNANYQYYFEITDGCENFYGFSGDIHSGWYKNVELSAMNSSTHCGLQTTKFGTYIFTVDHSYLTDDAKSYPIVSVTYPPAYQAADKVIYLDNDVLKWTNSNNAEGKNKIYYRIGRSNHNNKHEMELVPGTANLYKVTTHEYDNFEVWHIANNGCWSGDYSVYKTNTGYGWDATQATAFETLPVTSSVVTVTPTDLRSVGGDENNNNCEFYNYDITEGMKTWNATVNSTTNGTITVSYTDHDGTAKSDFTSGYRDLAHTCLLTINATPAEGYSLATLTVNDQPFTSGTPYTLTENATIEATFTINTYTITLDQQEATTPGITTVEATYGSALPSIAENLPTKTGYNFGGYFTEPNGNGTQYYHGTGNGARNWNIASETTLYAYWKPNTCTLIFNMNGGVGEQPNLTATYDQPMPALTAPLPTLSGFEFSGYFDEKTGGVKYYNAAGESARNWDKTNGEKTLYAQWAAIHTITWMVNGSQAEGDPTTSVVNGQTITTLPTTPDVDCNGKVFVGWTTATIYGETATIPDPLYTELGAFPVVTSDMTFYAVFANGSGDERWVETKINDIEATDEVVVMMAHGANLYALPYDKENASNSNPVATPITLDDFAGTISGTLIWYIKKGNEGNITLSPKTATDKYLTCNKSSNAVRINTGENRNFTIENDFLKNTAFSTYLAISTTAGTPDWRHFAPTNTTIVDRVQTLKFYKKTTVYTEYTNYSTSCMAGVCDITNANPIYVTSAVGQKIKATEKLVLTTTDMVVGTEISLSAPNITFYKEGVEIPRLTTSAASETFELEIAYQPTIANITEQPTITFDILGYKFTIDNKITGRSLPESFAIVAKVGNIWYALPSQGLNSETTPVGYPVEVDNNDNPTAVTAVPANADWSLRQVYEASRVDATKDRFVANGENLVFVNNASPAMALNASVSGNYVLTDAQYANYYQTHPGLYEWTPTTSDLETYTLTNAERTDRTLNVSINTVFGVHFDNKATTEVRFLPIENRYTPLALQAVEWKENSVVVMYNGDPKQTASISVNGGSVQTTELSGDGVQKDIAVYELTANGLADNPTQRLSITIGSEKVILPIPYIVSGDLDDATLLGGKELTIARRQEIAKISDLVILNGGSITAERISSNYYKFRNVTIYGGGSLIIPADKGFGANTLTMRVGGVENREYVYTYPQLDLNGTINSGNINLDLMTTYDYYYPFSVPYEVTLTDIHYPVEIYGSNVKPTNKGSFLVSYYDGEERAKGNSGWKDVEEQGKEVLSPHVGYSIWGLPKKVSVNGATDRQTYGIHRIPMKKTADVVMSNETTNQNVSISAYNATRDNDKGWNFIGNPYLVQHGGLDGSATDVYMGLLEKEMKDGQWTGGWVFNGEQVRYVTQTNDCLNYTSTPVTNATIPAFSAFFIQAKETGAIAFTSPNVAAAQSLAARRSDENKEITTGIILSGEKHSDRTGLLVADEFTEAYEFNADLSKFDNQDMNLYTISSSGKLAFMAINEELAKQTIPLGYSVSADGMYTIAFDEQRYNRNDIYALYLIDYDRNETTNLLQTDYNFYSETGTHAERFALQVAFAQKTPTDVEYTQVGNVLVSREGNTLRLDNLPSNATVTIYDAVGHLIEQHSPSQHLQVNLPTGYYLMHIANKQDAVVIDTFIP